MAVVVVVPIGAVPMGVVVVSIGAVGGAVAVCVAGMAEPLIQALKATAKPMYKPMYWWKRPLQLR
ncbi:MAG: hypothetical protein M3N51_09370 [Actinomycetota bacterium]|nr:hypothetical protein [Actinomycetota bacterium]